MKLQDVLDKIKEEIKIALEALGYFNQEIDIIIEQPRDKNNGDYATNVAMQYARVARKNPMVIAEELEAHINKTNAHISKIVIARPGFMNFFLNKGFLTDTINAINSNPDYGSLSIGKGEHYNIEFVSVNPTGALHIGHARGAAAGDSISRILEKAGYQVTREYYVNDGGNQIHNLAISIEARYKQAFGLDVQMPEDGYYGPEIIEAGNKVKDEFGDKYLHQDGYEFFKSYGVNTLLDELKKDLADFRVSFNIWFSEKSLYENDEVKKTVNLLTEKGYTYEADGALWLKTGDFLDEKDRVIIKSDGNYTYVTPDIAYHKNKLDRGYTKLINILGGDHHGYINRLKSAIEMIGGKSDLLQVELLQMVKVIQDGEEVKMSKRSGKAITLRDLIDEVGVDPIRYFFAARGLNSQMDLDLDLALKQTNENPVYYVQYAHARIHSIFRMATEKGFNINDLPNTFTTLDSEKAYDLMTVLANYPDAIQLAAEQLAPHKLTIFIHQLASAFHSFYNDEQVVTTDQLRTMERLALLKATAFVLKDALSLVGVSAPEKM